MNKDMRLFWIEVCLLFIEVCLCLHHLLVCCKLIKEKTILEVHLLVHTLESKYAVTFQHIVIKSSSVYNFLMCFYFLLNLVAAEGGIINGHTCWLLTRPNAKTCIKLHIKYINDRLLCSVWLEQIQLQHEVVANISMQRANLSFIIIYEYR